MKRSAIVSALVVMFSLMMPMTSASSATTTVRINENVRQTCVFPTCYFRLQSVTFDSRASAQMGSIRSVANVTLSGVGTVYARTRTVRDISENRFSWSNMPNAHRQGSFRARLESRFVKGSFSSRKSTSKSWLVTS